MKKKLFVLSAVIIGIVLGMFITKDIINSILLPNYKFRTIEGIKETGLYRVYLDIEEDIKEKDVERLGKQVIITLKKQNSKISQVIIFIYKDDKLYARANFEEEERYLMSEKKGEYKGLYYTVDME